MSPLVSIIIPCHNEVSTIRSVLLSIHQQTFPIDEIETIISDGMSSDGTRREVQRFIDEHSNANIKLIDNPSQTIPSALNRAIELSHGEIVVRLDGHSTPEPDYVERCVDVSQQTSAANVGGRWTIRPSSENWIARSIAVAASHPFGAGNARYRIGGEAGEVETVPFGAFSRKWLEKVGAFNEELLTNEDYEYNLRLRQAGGVVWFDPSIRSTYFARSDLVALLKQYGRYGFWKAQMLRLHPKSIRWRQAVAPLFVITLMSLLLGGLIQPLAWALLAAILLIYSAVMLAAGAAEGIRKQDLGLVFGVPLALTAIHISWGGAFLWGMVRSKVGGAG